MKTPDTSLIALVGLLTLAGLASCGRPEITEEQQTALLEVAERGDLTALETLLAETRTVDVRDSCDWTPLMKAALYGHTDVVARLLASGAEVDAQDKGGYTAMMLAASNDHAAVVDLLVRGGAMIDHQERTEGVTALSWSAGKGHLKTVEVLLQHGADATLKDFAGHRAVDRARAGGHDAVVARLSG
jgi:ankyrin repeat protein